MKLTLHDTLESLGYVSDGWLGDALSIKYANSAREWYNVYKWGGWIHSSGSAGLGEDELLEHHACSANDTSILFGDEHGGIS